jgi:hypothetical protein
MHMNVELISAHGTITEGMDSKFKNKIPFVA